MLKNYKKITKIAISVLFIAIFAFIYLNQTDEKAEAITTTLVSCVDGDTAVFMVGDKEEKVRFIGIDAPEYLNENYGKQAGEFTCKLLKGAYKIELIKEPKSKKRDKYERLLYWIMVDDELLEVKILEEGLANVAYINDDYLYTDLLYEAQNKAKSEKIGIWEE